MKLNYYQLSFFLLMIFFTSYTKAQQNIEPQIPPTSEFNFWIKDDRNIAVDDATVIFVPIYQGTAYQIFANNMGAGKYQLDLPINVAIGGNFNVTISAKDHETFQTQMNMTTENNSTKVISYNNYYEKYSVDKNQLIEQFFTVNATINISGQILRYGTVISTPNTKLEEFTIPFPLNYPDAEKLQFAQAINPYLTRKNIYYDLIKEIVLQTSINETNYRNTDISEWLENNYQVALNYQHSSDALEMMKEFAGIINAPINSLSLTTINSFSNILFSAAKASEEGLFKAVLLAFSYQMYQQQCMDLFIKKKAAAFNNFDPAFQDAIITVNSDLNIKREEQLEDIILTYRNKHLSGEVAISALKEVASLLPNALCSVAGISLSAGPQIVLYLVTKFTIDVLEGSIESRDLQLRMILLAQLEKYVLSNYESRYSSTIASEISSNPDIYFGTLMHIHSGYLYHTMRNKLYSTSPNMTMKIINPLMSTPFTRKIAEVSQNKSDELANEYFKLNYDYLKNQQSAKPPIESSYSKITLGLILDSSGSMSKNDPQNIRKTAAELIVNQLSNSETNIFLVDFDDRSNWLNDGNWGNWDKSDIIRKIQNINSNGGTNIGGGLNEMKQALDGRIPLGENVGILLLTDGIGDYNNEAEWFSQNKIRVSTISFMGNDNAGLLRDIANLTGGDYMKANTPEDIVNTFNEFLTKLTGSSTICLFQHNINQGQSISYDYYIDPGMKNYYASCVWYGSKVGLSLTSPDGINYTPNMANSEWVTGNRYISAKINNPKPGKWKAEFVGLDIPPEGEPFNFKVNGDAPIIIDIIEHGLHSGVAAFSLDKSQSKGNIKEINPTISLITPKNNSLDITNRYQNGRFDFIPVEGKGNYQIKINLTGKDNSDQVFQRHLAKTVLIGEYTPLNIAPVKQIIGNYVKAGLGRIVGNRSGILCYIYPMGESNNQKIAKGYVTFVTENECTIEIQQLLTRRQLGLGDIVELDLAQWKNDIKR